MIGQDALATGFTSKEVRRQFVRKVYTILAVQLTVTALIIGFFQFNPDAHAWKTESNIKIALWLFLLTYLCIFCCPGLRRTYPTNMILLCVFTLSMAFLTALATLESSSETVLLAAVICAVCCIGVSVLSLSTKCDITECRGILAAATLGFIVFGFIMMFWDAPYLQKIHAGLGALLFMAYLAVDTQMIMGGKRFEIDPEEHVYAAITLYYDIICLFIKILQLLNEKEERKR